MLAKPFRSSREAALQRSWARHIAGMKVEGNVFVVTGGASGLGEAATRAIVAQKGKVIIFDIAKQAEKANQLISEIGPSDCCFIACDVTNEDSIVAGVEAAGNKWGKINGNINCVSSPV